MPLLRGGGSAAGRAGEGSGPLRWSKPNDREKCYFYSYDPCELQAVIETQQQVINYQKNNNDLYHSLIVIDDFADAPGRRRQMRELAFILLNLT